MLSRINLRVIKVAFNIESNGQVVVRLEVQFGRTCFFLNWLAIQTSRMFIMFNT